MNCEICRSRLTLFALGDLIGADAEEIQKHLESCGECSTAYPEIELTVELLRQSLTSFKEAPVHLSSENWKRIMAADKGLAGRSVRWVTQGHPRLAVAAGLMLVAGISWFLVSSMRYQREDAPRYAPTSESIRDYDVEILTGQPTYEDAPPSVTPGITVSRPSPRKSKGAGRSADVAPGEDDFFFAVETASGEGGETVTALFSDGDAVAETEPVPEPARPPSPVAGKRISSESKREGGVTPIIAKGTGTERGGLDPSVTVPTEESLQRFGKDRAGANFGDLSTVNGPVVGEAKYETVSEFGIKQAKGATELAEPGPPEPIELPAAPDNVDSIASGGFVSFADDVKDAEPSDYNGTLSKSDNRDLRGTTRGGKLEEQRDKRRVMSKNGDSGVVSLEDDETERFTLRQKKLPGAGAAQIVQSGLANETRVSARRPEQVMVQQEATEDITSQHAPVSPRPKPDPADAPVLGLSPVVDEKKSEREEDDGYARFEELRVNPFYGVSERSMSTFSIDVDTASYTVARNYLNRGVLPPRAAVRTEEFVNFLDYGYEAPRKETFRVYTECAPSKFGRGLHLLKVGVKGRRLGREEQRGAVLTVLIDTSGSMEQPDRMGLVRKSVKMLVESLGADDLVALVQYDSHARVVLEHTKAKNRKKILDALNGLQCGGSTNLEEGMSRAYTLAAGSFKGGAENRVLVLSDGVANLGSVAAEDILGKVAQYRKQGITCSVFGFGMGTYDDKMLESLADKGNGAYAFVDSEDEARRLLVEDLGATLHTIASDVKIQVEFNPKRVKRYRQLGYENRQLRREDFRNDMVDAGEVGSGQSVTALYEVELMEGEKPDRVDDLATIRVRYMRIDTGDVEETSHAVAVASVASRFDDMPARYRLAAGVAEFSEILRGSTHAAGSELEQVAGVLRPVAMELNLDKRVQELLRLVESAKGMSRAGE
jgi:Ca-activated chloride channel family protein